MTGSTSESGRRALVAVLATAALIAGLTALVFLIRAGDATMANWPTTWELRSSDNGVLFQFMQDVASGTPLQWRFSPQVYLIPELPISALGFVLAGGNLYVYYLVIAVLNNVLLFGAFLLLVRAMSPQARWTAAVLRAGAAMLPLLITPMIGTSWILSFHLAATYYIGMYLTLIVAPAVLLVQRRWTRIVLAVLLAASVACNPLTMVFAAPGLAAVVVLGLVTRRMRELVRPLILVGGTLVGALVLWILVQPLQGRSAFDYVGGSVFSYRLTQLQSYYTDQFSDPALRVILVIGGVCAVLCAVGALLVAARYILPGSGADRSPAGVRRAGTVIFLGFIPLGGIAATVFAQITHYLYFWPALILPLSLVVLILPRPALPAVISAGLTGMLVIGVYTDAADTLSHPERYFGYRTPETACLDAAVPGRVGYATFSDARRLSLPSTTGVQLIQVYPDTTIHTWLSNVTRERVPGSFFYINGSGDEPAIDTGMLRDIFGAPSTVVACSQTQSVWIYNDPAAQASIAAYYARQVK